MLCIANDDGTSAKSIIEMLIKEVFRIHELSTSIIFDRGSQFVIII